MRSFWKDAPAKEFVRRRQNLAAVLKLAVDHYADMDIGEIMGMLGSSDYVDCLNTSFRNSHGAEVRMDNLFRVSFPGGGSATAFVNLEMQNRASNFWNI